MVTQWGWWLYIVAGPLVYWALPVRFRAPFLAAISIATLSFYDPVGVASMGALAVLTFAAHRWRQTFSGLPGKIARSPALVLSVVGYLFWTKYIPAFATAIGGPDNFLAFAAPVGVSYFTFKLLHYIIEHRWRGFPPHTFSDFLSFMFLMPIFTAGPIERFEHYLANRGTVFKFDYVVEGGSRIAMGIIKKFLLGMLVVEAIQRATGGDVLTMIANFDSVETYRIWIYLYLALFIIYIDFSAYSDIAIGASRLFGLRIMENFNFPFIATSLRDFWLRWHMTLALWCRTYIYMPIIGLTRNPYGAIVATFVVMGTWHAGWPPQWILWGLWHGVGSVVALTWTRFALKRKIRIFKGRAGAVAGWAITMNFVALGGAFTALWGRAPVIESLRLLGRAFALPV